MNIIAPINQLSYGLVSWNIMKELDLLTNISFFEIIDRSSQPTQEQVPFLRKWIKNAQMFDPYEPCLRIWHQNDMAKRVGKAKLIGWPIFELNGFSSLEKHHLSTLDEIIVCSEWAKSIVLGNVSTKKCHVVPLGVDTSIFYNRNTTLNKYVFLNIGKMEYRKGHDLIIAAFSDAFNKNDNVELWLSWDNPFPNCNKNYWINLCKSSKLSSKIKFIPRLETQEELSLLANQASCGIFPSRAEGWNLPLLEMMACGKPVIATNYSAHTEYCNTDNSFLVDCELEPAKDNEWPQFDGTFEWGKPNYDQLVEHMRYVYNNNIRNNIEGEKIANKLSWASSARKVLDAVNN